MNLRLIIVPSRLSLFLLSKLNLLVQILLQYQTNIFVLTRLICLSSNYLSSALLVLVAELRIGVWTWVVFRLANLKLVSLHQVFRIYTHFGFLNLL